MQNLSWKAVKNITTHWELLQGGPACQNSLKIYDGPQVFLIRSFHSHSAFALEQGTYSALRKYVFYSSAQK